jgi:ABC-type lipoprotein export system ATPase subunit
MISPEYICERGEMMHHIEHIHIEGFWGKYTVDTAINKDVNIFVGANGSGKTTLMNIIHAALDFNTEALLGSQFTLIDISLRDRRKHPHILLRCNPDDKNVHIEYSYPKFGGKLPLDFQRRSIFNREKLQRHAMFRKTLSEHYNMSWLSIRRESINIHSRQGVEELVERTTDPLDERINLLISLLNKYRLSLEEKINVVSKEFQRDVLLKLLTPEVDPSDSSFSFSDLDKVEMELKIVYKELEIPNQIARSQIKKHMLLLTTVRDKLSSEDEEELDLFDLLYPMSAIDRVRAIHELAEITDTNKEEILSQINLYRDIYNKFLIDKQMKIKEGGGLDFFKEKDDITLDIFNLSSGEKQLFVLLTEALIQDSKRYIYLADEPEMSLHVSWQERLIKSILEINPKAQILFATHSPEIISDYDEKIIFMEDILHE